MKATRAGNRSLRTLHTALLTVFLGAAAFGQAGGSPTPEKVSVVYGQHIHYIEAGKGPAVILLHGLGGTKEHWDANFAALASKYHVYALDQLGFGHSDKPLIEYKIATWVDFLQGFLQSEKIPKATVVGNSMGGWIALDFTVTHPEMVDKLVLVDASGLTGKIPIDLLAPSSIAEWRTLLASVFYDKKIVTDDVARQAFTDRLRNNDGYTIERTLAGFARPQFEDDKLKAIHVPTLVVWGRNDKLVPVEDAKRFGRGIPGAKVVVFEQCGHVPQIEKPEEFNRALLEFLGG